MREARQQRQGDYRPLACERCGEDLYAAGLSEDGASLLCGDCRAESDPWEAARAWGDA